MVENANVANSPHKCGLSAICKLRPFCYHIVSPRDKPTEPKRKRLAAVTGTIKNIVSPILEKAKDTIAEPTAQQSYLLVLKVCEWNHSTYLWNRAFCVLQPKPDGLVPSIVLLRYLSLPESGGKDKTMMMNMMTGAVAINGGVGVMEIRQPKRVDQMLENAVQTADQMAMIDFMEKENAEILADEELRKLYAAMSKLTERQTEVLQLYFYKGMTQQEIAEKLGMRQQSVNDCLKGALKKIRKIF